MGVFRDIIMSSAFFSSLLSGGLTYPESLINKGGPLPSLQGAPPQFHAGTHAHINDRARLLGDISPYAYGQHPSLIGSQTQNNIPNKKQLVISRIFLPSSQADGATTEDPVLEHALSTGDIAFSLRMREVCCSCAIRC